VAEASLQLVRDELHFEMGIATEDPAGPARTLSEFCFGGQADPPAEDLLSWKMNVSLALQKFLKGQFEVAIRWAGDYPPQSAPDRPLGAQLSSNLAGIKTTALPSGVDVVGFNSYPASWLSGTGSGSGYRLWWDTRPINGFR